MKTKDAIRYFGTQDALAKALGIKQSAVGQWPERVPELRQLQLELLTKGELKADPAVKNPGQAA
jgi:DNA-binding transcriptional regulator YdaS (Cro superfamily)